MKSGKNRIIELDYVRTIAILMIFFNHAISIFYIDQLNPTLYNSISMQSRFFMVNSYIVSRLGVPLFLFLTGSLVLSKNFENFNDIKKFYKNNLLTLLISVVIWNFIYYFIDVNLTDSKFSVNDLLLTLLFLKKSVYGHMWYMPMIIGMYLYLPFISMIVKKYNIKKLVIPITASLIIFFVIPYVNVILNYLNLENNLAVQFDMTFSGAQYGLYIILGYYIFDKQLFYKVPKRIKYLLIIVGYILCVLLQIFLYKISAKTIVYYNFIGVFLFSSLIFSIVINSNLKRNRIIEYLSKNSLGIFFIHFPVLVILNNIISLEINRPIAVICFYIMGFTISILINELLKLIKTTRVYLLRYK